MRKCREIYEVFGGSKILFRANGGIDLDGDSFYPTYTLSKKLSAKNMAS